jgi:hypothetical protein
MANIELARGAGCVLAEMFLGDRRSHVEHTCIVRDLVSTG